MSTMWISYFVTYLHYLSFILVCASLFVELFFVKRIMFVENLRRVVKADAIYGIFSIVLVTTGLLRVFLYGKGSDYYFSNWIFNVKFSLFILVGLLSILPTIRFLKLNKKHSQDGGELQIELEHYKTIKLLIKLELILMLIIPFLAILMANGVGM